jgi:hypothetical protein
MHTQCEGSGGGKRKKKKPPKSGVEPCDVQSAAKILPCSAHIGRSETPIG